MDTSGRKPSLHTLRVMYALSIESELCGADLIRMLSMPSGTIYPILLRLEKQGLISSVWERKKAETLGRPRRRLYRITGSGVGFLDESIKELGLNPQLAWGTQ